MRSGRIRAAFGGALCLLATAALAQPAEKPTAVPPVTVEGKAQPKTIEKQSWSFVLTYAVGGSKLGLIGRWREPICVQVVNVAPEQAAQIKARIEQVAKGVGLKAARPGCKSNIQIVLTSQPQAFIDKVARGDEHALGYHQPSDLAKVKSVSQPIQAWYKSATQGAKVGHDGLPFASIKGGQVAFPASQIDIPNEGSLLGETQSAESVDIAENGSPRGCAGSLISDCTRSVFTNVLVVMDSHAVEGKDLGALSDYLAMVALSQARSLGGCSDLPSIIDLLATPPCVGRDAPDGLTTADASFLTALYAANPEAKAISEQNDIAGRMARVLIKANAAKANPRAP